MNTTTFPGYYVDTPIARAGLRSEALGSGFMHWSLGVVFLWFGAMKFGSAAATGIAPLVANSPLVGWWHSLLGLQGTANLLGVLEMTTGVLLLAGFIRPMLSVIGGAMGVITFLITLSFLFTTPGVAEPLAGGFPALSAMPGQFLLKDLGLLGISIFILGESLLRMRQTPGDWIPTHRAADLNPGTAGARIFQIGTTLLRYGLALIFLWFGAMKFTSYEAAGIAPFIANSPLVGWWHALLGIQGASTMLGVFEITTAVLLVLCPIAPRVCVVGGAMAVFTFLITLSFFFTTPGVVAPTGFPALTPVGEFLLKDLALLGISIWLLGEALVGSARRVAPPPDARSTLEPLVVKRAP